MRGLTVEEELDAEGVQFSTDWDSLDSLLGGE